MKTRENIKKYFMDFIFCSFHYYELKKLAEEVRHPEVALREESPEEVRAVLARAWSADIAGERVVCQG
jgi:hypothetical protein